MSTWIPSTTGLSLSKMPGAGGQVYVFSKLVCTILHRLVLSSPLLAQFTVSTDTPFHQRRFLAALAISVLVNMHAHAVLCTSVRKAFTSLRNVLMHVRVFVYVHTIVTSNMSRRRRGVWAR